MIKENIKTILKEISLVLDGVNQKEVDAFVEEILNAQKIILTGAGRVGMAVRGFAMRMGHMGYEAFMVGDSTVPSITSKDLLIVASGSGETQTIYDLVTIAKERKSKIALITGNSKSRMGLLADTVVEIKAPSKTKPVFDFTSIQPMTTLNEQCLGILFDAIVLILMYRTGENHDSMWERHSNLE